MKRRRLLTRCLLWGAVVLWMAVIFLFSGQNGEDSSSLSGSITAFLLRLFVSGFDSMPPADQSALAEPLQFLVRKCAHAGVYAVLGILSFAGGRRPFLPAERTAAAADAVLRPLRRFGRAAQAFIPGRSPQLADVLIDCGGALAGILLAALAVLLHRHCRKKPPSGEEPMGLPAAPYSVFPPPRGFRFFGAFFL